MRQKSDLSKTGQKRTLVIDNNGTPLAEVLSNRFVLSLYYQTARDPSSRFK